MQLLERLSESATKSVKYFGYQILVPKSTTHMATDGDGQTYAYIGPPDFDRNLDVWMGNAVVGAVAVFNLEGAKANSTLVEVAK